LKPRIRILAVGGLKEPYLREGQAALISSLKGKLDISVHEAPEARIADKHSDANIKAALEKEGLGLLAMIKPGEKVAALAIDGDLVDASSLKELVLQGAAALVIGGSYGLGANILSRAERKISFSRLTFPHQLMRLILLDALDCALRGS
jgi:23S rRNA (pseudouridine1915-N3)-methyltransferase